MNVQLSPPDNHLSLSPAHQTKYYMDQPNIHSVTRFAEKGRKDDKANGNLADITILSQIT